MKIVRVVAAVICDNIHTRNRIFATARGYGEYKGQWEFPGGKIEPGETPQEALLREIREELDTVISVGEQIGTIEYDYPNFHLSMDCFWAEVVEGELILKEAEAARWLTKDELEDVAWLPADISILKTIREGMEIIPLEGEMKLIHKIAYLYLQDGKLLSTRSRGKDAYYIPGGKPEGEETELETLVREVKEELSIDIIPETAKLYGVFEAQAHGKAEGVLVRMTCYTADFTGEIKADNEIEEIRWMTTADVELVSPVDKLIYADLYEKGLLL